MRKSPVRCTYCENEFVVERPRPVMTAYVEFGIANSSALTKLWRAIELIEPAADTLERGDLRRVVGLLREVAAETVVD